MCANIHIYIYLQRGKKSGRELERERYGWIDIIYRERETERERIVIGYTGFGEKSASLSFGGNIVLEFSYITCL